jgi:hypothetical protein
MLLDGEGCPAAMAASPSTTRARRAPTAGTTGTGAVHRAEGSAVDRSRLLHRLLLRCEANNPPFAPVFLRGARPPFQEPRRGDVSLTASALTGQRVGVDADIGHW